MSKKLSYFGFVLIFAVFLLVLMFAENSFAAAGDCTANVQFEGIQSPKSFNQPITLRAAVTLSGFINGGADNGYCRYSQATASFVYKIIHIYYDFGSGPNLSRVPPTPVSGDKFRIASVPYPPNTPTMHRSVSVTPSDFGFKDGDTFSPRVHVIACGSSLGQSGCVALTTSGTQNVRLGAGIYSNYACVGKNSQGQDVYICDAKNASDCSNTVGCASKQPCIKLGDSNLCGKPVPQSTHKECRNKVCVVVAGSGADACTSSPDSCIGGGSGNGTGGGTGGGSTTTRYTFNLPNPIGVENFQDLINIIGKWIFNLAIPIAVIIIIYAGVLMLTAGGVPARFQKGAKALWYAVIGLAIVLIGKGFVTLIQSILSLRNK